MPFTRSQIAAIAAQKEKELGRSGMERYMHNLKKESIKKYGYFMSSKTKMKKKGHAHR